jgi:hypothetical protein
LFRRLRTERWFAPFQAQRAWPSVWQVWLMLIEQRVLQRRALPSAWQVRLMLIERRAWPSVWQVKPTRVM